MGEEFHGRRVRRMKLKPEAGGVEKKDAKRGVVLALQPGIRFL